MGEGLLDDLGSIDAGDAPFFTPAESQYPIGVLDILLELPLNVHGEFHTLGKRGAP